MFEDLERQIRENPLLREWIDLQITRPPCYQFKELDLRDDLEVAGLETERDLISGRADAYWAKRQEVEMAEEQEALISYAVQKIYARLEDFLSRSTH